MRAIIIGAGRGSRLKHETDEIPKTLVPAMGKPMLDWILDALGSVGISRRDVVFICGYRADVIRTRYPEFTFVENRNWENNNILLSLLCARDYLNEDVIVSYADIIYRPEIIERVTKSPYDLALGCDTNWRQRYSVRTQHPETDAEKLRADGKRVVEISRKIAPESASGEFIGVAKFTRSGTSQFVEAFDEAETRFAGRPFRDGRMFEKAYLIDHFAFMLERGVALHRENIHGGYMELDTLEDLSYAQTWWDAWRDGG